MFQSLALPFSTIRNYTPKKEVPLELIVNADDFGWDNAANDAILELATLKAISSTTIMANLIENSLLQELNKLSFISKGIHLNLIDGEPVSDPDKIKTIINKQGQFFSSSELFINCLKGKVKTEDIITETKAQINKLRTAGIAISHADSHQHIHQFPLLSAPILKALQEEGINKVRKVNIPYFHDNRRIILKLFHFATKHNLTKFKSPNLLLSDFSIHGYANDEVFKKSINKIKNVTELMVHPGTRQRRGSYLNRVSEYNYLKSNNWEYLLKKNKIELISYNHL